MANFAITIPNLNQSHFLSTALESLKYQTAPFQLAVIDGGSNDNFNDVIQQYDNLVTFVRSYKDNGQASAIREGKEKIKGDILSWLNADDYYFPGALEKVAAIFQDHPDIDVVYGEAIHVTPEGFFQSYFPPIQQFNAKELTKNCFICQPSCFYRRKAYENVGGLNPSLHYTMDWDLWCRLSLSGANFYYLHEPLAAVRYYHGTKTLSGDKNRFKEISRIEKKYGHRLLRISVLGAYFYGLTFKKRKNIGEMGFYILFDLLRKIKNSNLVQAYKNENRKTLLYGFHRWTQIVDGHCEIRMPWYGKTEWKRLRLRVKPNNKRYNIKINSQSCRVKFNNSGILVVEVPKLDNPDRIIEIECQDQHKWKLEDFSCDLNSSNPQSSKSSG